MTSRAHIVMGGAGIAAAAEALSGRLAEVRILVVDKLPPLSLTSANSPVPTPTPRVPSS